MFDYVNELLELGIPQEKIYSLDKFEKSTSTWKRLINDLKSLPSEMERIKVIDKIIQKAAKDRKYQTQLKPVTPPAAVDLRFKSKLMKPKFPEIKRIANELLDREKKIICLKHESNLKENSEEFDLRKECKGAAYYVCHHCGRNMCSQHSYWIPDREFPYVVKKTFESQLKKDEDKERKAKQQIALGVILLIIGFALIPLYYSLIALSIILWLAGVALLYLGYKKLKELLFEVGRYYPTFVKSKTTKWERNLEVRFEHQGYYTAVHCWNCLKAMHSEVYQTAQTILDGLYQRSFNWQRLRGDIYEKIPDDMRMTCALYAANLYLNEFKYGWRSYIPLKGIIRTMVRPQFYKKYSEPAQERIFNPTPIWLFEPITNLKSKRTPSIQIDTWLNWNEKQIKNIFGLK